MMWIPRINAKYFSLPTDGVTDCRVQLQAALDAAAGGDLVIPCGIYAVGANPGHYWCLKVPRGTRVRGEHAGAVSLVMLPCGPSVRLLELEESDVVIADLELDGNKAAMPPDEHRAGIFVAAPRVTIEHVVVRHFSGDGIYIYAGGNNVDMRNVRCSDNARNGLTLGGGTDKTFVVDCDFLRNGAQQVDSEPKGVSTVDSVLIDRCRMDSEGVSGDYALTVTGSGAGSRSTDWTVRNCIISGGVQVCWADGVRIDNCLIDNPTTKPCVRVYRSTARVLIDDCTMQQVGAASAIVDVQGTAGQAPESISIKGNTMRASAPTTHGITCELASTVSIEGNTIIGAGVPQPYVSGIYARTTLVTQPMRLLDVHNNCIGNFGQYGMLVNNVAGCLTEAVEVSDNRFVGSPSMLFATGFDGGCLDVMLERNRNESCIQVAPLRPAPGFPVLADPVRNEWRWVVPASAP